MADELTLEQQKALARARARLRLQQAESQPIDEQAPKETDAQRRARFIKEEFLSSPPMAALRGVKDVIDTGAEGAAWLSDKVTGGNEFERVRAMNKAGKSEFDQATSERVMPALARVGGNITATAPFVGFTGAAVSRAGLPSAGNAISSWGGSAGVNNRLLDLLLRSGGGGVAGGISSGLVNPDSAETGAVVGAAAVPVLGGLSTAAEAVANRIIKPSWNLISKSGPANILRKFVAEKIGEKNVAATVTAAQNAANQQHGPGLFGVPGYKPTMAEAVHNIPEGSPVVAMQDLTARTYGGPSAKFFGRAQDNVKSLDNAEIVRDLIAGPARSAALTSANKGGGVSVKSIVKEIDNMLNDPELDTEIVNKTLLSIRDKLTNKALASKTGLVDAKRLYNIRKWEIGNNIRKFADETKTTDQQLLSGLETQVQRVLDTAIEKAGGTGWKNYLAEYSTRTREVTNLTKRMQEMYNPVQKTNLDGGLNMAEETRTHIPNLLSRTAMASNFVLRMLGKKIEPKVDELAAVIFSDPAEYARLMQNVPKDLRLPIDNALRAANATLLASYRE